jgi:hypothetical protein
VSFLLLSWAGDTVRSPFSPSGRRLVSRFRAVVDRTAIDGNSPLRVLAPSERPFHNVLLSDLPEELLCPRGTEISGFPHEKSVSINCAEAELPAPMPLLVRAIRTSGSSGLFLAIQVEAELPHLDESSLIACCERAWDNVAM